MRPFLAIQQPVLALATMKNMPAPAGLLRAPFPFKLETDREGEKLGRRLTTAHMNKRMNQHVPGCEVVSLLFGLHELSRTRKKRKSTHGPATQAMNWVMSSSSRLSTTLQPSGGSLRSCASSFAIRRMLDEARDMML